jgi:hypothetical protein
MLVKCESEQTVQFPAQISFKSAPTFKDFLILSPPRAYPLKIFLE